MGNTTRNPYSERSDIERLRSSWKKLSGLMQREEWSAAITRAATAAEIAANIAVRHELQEQRHLEAEFVDHLLKWANGLSGKLDRILRPLHTTKAKQKTLKSLQKKARRINDQRNLVVHSGNFMNKEEAEEIVSVAKEFIEKLVEAYHKGFKL
ncbi:MAG: hypothetical protein PHN82_11680 [bacterium]|nr:hypothetical protein [bacterium]